MLPQCVNGLPQRRLCGQGVFRRGHPVMIVQVGGIEQGWAIRQFEQARVGFVQVMIDRLQIVAMLISR